jgi:hypothetical protein
MHKVAFLDTNIYLHYQLFDQIKWLEVLKASEVTIIIPPITLRELNRQKELNTRSRVKQRAGLVLNKLSSLFENELSACICDGVEICLEDRDPMIDFSQLQLNPDIQDDQLIASIVMFRSERPEVDVILVTSDAGLALIGKARRHNIQVTKLPENLKLPEEPDQDQIRIRELEKKLRDLELKIPQLSLVFADGSQHATFTLEHPVEMTKDEIAGKIELVKKQYPKMKQQTKQKSELAGQFAAIAEAMANFNASMGNVLLPEDIEKYNTELDEFYQAYSEYLRKGVWYENLRCRTVNLSMYVANDGTAPAEDIDVFLHFPDGFEIMDKHGFPKTPELPNPPDEPKTQMQRMISMIKTSEYFSPIMGYIPDVISASRNVSVPTIRKTGSYEVEFYVERIKHKLQEAADPLYISFESFEAAQSFKIDYRLLAANIPEEVTGQLHVVINKDSKTH